MTYKVNLDGKPLEDIGLSPEAVEYFHLMELKTVEFLYAAIVRNPGAFEILLDKNPQLGSLQDIVYILQSNMEDETATEIEENCIE